MIRVCLSTNYERKWVLVNPNNTIKNILTKHNIPFKENVVLLDGLALTSSELNKPLSKYDITDSNCYLSSVIKSSN